MNTHLRWATVLSLRIVPIGAAEALVTAFFADDVVSRFQLIPTNANS